MSNTKEMKRKLFDRLKEYYPDKDFVCGVISNVKNEIPIKLILEG